ncbi:MAG: thioredoxin [Acholeplasmatales bacterium]
MKEFNGENFLEEISEGVVLVDFFATWCGPCKMIGPHLNELANEVKDVKFLKVDVDNNSELKVKYQIKNIPTLVLFKDGVEVSRRVGFATKNDIYKWISSH